jgi:hypothetical protein
MTLAEVKECVERVEDRLGDHAFVVAWTEERNGRLLHVALTDRLRRLARKGRVWKTPHFLATLRNAEYGYDEAHARSRGGTDGVFLLDRAFHPPNAMMHKLFDRYVDHPESGFDRVAAALHAAPAEFLPVRLVSHHMRLLGVLLRRGPEDWLVLVDFDTSE